jgi:hypothetical protein
VAPAAFRSRPAKTKIFSSSSSDLQSRACALTFFYPAARFFTKKRAKKFPLREKLIRHSGPEPTDGDMPK